MLVPHADLVGGTELQCVLVSEALLDGGLHTVILTHRALRAACRSARVPIVRVSQPLHNLAMGLGWNVRRAISAVGGRFGQSRDAQQGRGSGAPASATGASGNEAR